MRASFSCIELGEDLAQFWNLMHRVFVVTEQFFRRIIGVPLALIDATISCIDDDDDVW